MELITPALRMKKAILSEALTSIIRSIFLLIFGFSTALHSPAVDLQVGSPIGFGDYIKDGLPSDATNLVDIAAAQSFTLGLRADGTVIGWGSSSHGALTIPGNLPRVKKIAAGYYFGI